MLIISSCSPEKRGNYTTLDYQGNKVMTQASRAILNDLLAEFNECIQSSTIGMIDCKHFTAKAICNFYEINEFETDNGYVNYEEMYDIIRGKFHTWELLGEATDQEVLQKAQEKANNGQATVAVSRKSVYGHVAMIVPGTLQKAPSWGGLDVPLCASFFLVKGLDSFIEKSLAYAWSSPHDIVIFYRKDD